MGKEIQAAKPNGDIVILGAMQEPLPSTEHYIWRIPIRAGDRYLHHIMPLDTMEWRSAEYDIDPDDRETLLDVVLAEPWFSDGINSYEHPSSLFNAETIDEAREFHLGRVANVKSDHGLYSAQQKDRRMMKSTSTDPREFIKSASHIDRRVIVVKKEVVGISRDRVRTKREKEKEIKAVQKASGMRLLGAPEPEFAVEDTHSDLRLQRLQRVIRGMRVDDGN